MMINLNFPWYNKYNNTIGSIIYSLTIFTIMLTLNVIKIVE